MRLVAIDTATEVCAVALVEDGRIAAERGPVLVRTHSQRLVPLLDEALSEAGWTRKDLNLVAVGEGPGSFTGVRIGISTAKAIAYALDLPLAAFSTLEAVALSALLPAGATAGLDGAAGPEGSPAPGDLICPLLDARRGEIYTALYRVTGGQTLALEHEAVSPALDAWLESLPKGEPVWFTGEGVRAYRERLQDAGGEWRIAATERLLTGAVGLLGQREASAGRTVSPLLAVPRYVRRSQAEVLWEERRLPGTC